MAINVISVALLFFVGHALNWVFKKTKIPDLLIILMIGYFLGPIFGYITPEDFGKTGPLISTVALVVILYQSGLTLTVTQLKECFLISGLLSLLSFFSIVIVTTLLCVSLGGMSLDISLLSGLALGATSSTVVSLVLDTLSIKERTCTILSLESSFTDVLAIVLFLVVADGIEKDIFSPLMLTVQIGPNTGFAILCGMASAMIWALFKKKFRSISRMAFGSEAWALLTYGVVDLVGLNGGIGVLALGFTLANIDFLPNYFKDHLKHAPISYRDMSLLHELVFILRTIFFIYLGVLIQFSDIRIVITAVFVTATVFITRYFIAQFLFSREGSKLDVKIISAMGPRDLASAVLATIPLQKGFEGGDQVQKLVFAVIPFTILVSALLIAYYEYKATNLRSQE